MKRVSASTGGATAFFAGLLARDEFSQRGMHVGFVEHAFAQLREEHRHLAELAFDPAAREQRTENVEILLQAHLLAAAPVVAQLPKTMW